jgi:hypothetical protein
MKKPRRFPVGRLFTRKSADNAPARNSSQPASGGKSLEPVEEKQVEMKMADQPAKKPVTDVAALREEVELLELQVRKLQAREYLQNYRIKRAAAKKG